MAKTAKKMVSTAVTDRRKLVRGVAEEKQKVTPNVRVCKVHIVGVCPYSQSKAMQTPRGQKEKPDDHDKRCWQERMHVDEHGVCFIPATAFKKAIDSAAGFLRERVPGKGQSEYGKHLRAGVMVMKNPTLGVKMEKVECEMLYVDSDGKAGSGKRVWRRFPVFRKWDCDVEFVIVDSTIDEDVFLRHLEEAGRLIGIGRWRGERGGMYGRFEIKNVKWC
jgi:hypothetical protein